MHEICNQNQKSTNSQHNRSTSGILSKRVEKNHLKSKNPSKKFGKKTAKSLKSVCERRLRKGVILTKFFKPKNSLEIFFSIFN